MYATQQPRLHRVRSDSAIQAAENASCLSYWQAQSSYVILTSLKPGREEPLVADSSGKILQGNTRVFVLQEGYFDIQAITEYVRKEGL